MFYVNIMVTTKQTPIGDIQEIQRKESKHTTTENQKIRKDKRNRGIAKQQQLN